MVFAPPVRQFDPSEAVGGVHLLNRLNLPGAGLEQHSIRVAVPMPGKAVVQRGETIIALGVLKIRMITAAVVNGQLVTVATRVTVVPRAEVSARPVQGEVRRAGTAASRQRARAGTPGDYRAYPAAVRASVLSRRESEVDNSPACREVWCFAPRSVTAATAGHYSEGKFVVNGGEPWTAFGCGRWGRAY